MHYFMGSQKYFLSTILLYFSITGTIWMAAINHIPTSNEAYILIQTFKSIPWALDGSRLLKHLWIECLKETSVQQSKTNSLNENLNYRINSAVIDCLKRKSLTTLDRTLNANVIPLYDGIDLVRYASENASEAESQRTMPSPLQAEPLLDIVDNSLSSDQFNKSIDFDWKTQVITKLINVFRTHVVKINVENDLTESESRSVDEYARRRRHRYMMPIFMFGTLAMAMILIPMGFKFLAVLGGKALLLAKMALLLASIQGLKRIATSNMNYGLYHIPYSATEWHDRHSRGEYLNSGPYVYEADALYGRGQQPADIHVAAIG